MMNDALIHALNVSLAVLAGLIVLMIVVPLLSELELPSISLDGLAALLFGFDEDYNRRRKLRRRRRRQRGWQTGIRIIQRSQEREAQRQMTRSEREAARSVAAEISHSLAIHQEILERMYGRNAAPMSTALWDVYRAGKRQKGR